MKNKTKEEKEFKDLIKNLREDTGGFMIPSSFDLSIFDVNEKGNYVYPKQFQK